jgi:hypothetical protein
VLYLPDSGAIANLAGVNASAVDIAGAEHALRDPEQGHLIARSIDNAIVFLHKRTIAFRAVMYVHDDFLIWHIQYSIPHAEY